MIINAANMRTLNIGFSAAFAGGLANVTPTYSRVAMVVPSGTKTQEYGWLGKFPKVREWIGERVIHGLATHRYAIVNKKFELTIEVDKDDIEDDNIGIYTPMFTEMGAAVAAFPDELAWPMLPNGFTAVCYDGRPFFDTQHPVLDASGAVTTVSNSGGGSGTPWYLIGESPGRVMKPVIYQTRREFTMTRMDASTDDNVFREGKALYGSDGRCNVGYGFWQLAYGSKQTLNKTSFAAAFAALEGMKGDYGRPLNIRPRMLVVPPALREVGLEILNAERDAAGATNVWRNTAELVVEPWLA